VSSPADRLPGARAAPPLPTRDGVGPSCVALPEGPWVTIAEFLAQRFSTVSPAAWAARIGAGEVLDEHGIHVTLARRYQPNVRVYYYRSLANEPRVPFDEVVLFQDARIVVADKPHFLPVTPSGSHLQETLLVRLKRRLGIDTLAPVHRIDRETAGLVLFSVEPSTRGRYQRVFAERNVKKTYECIAPWRDDFGLPLTHRSRLIDDTHFMRMREAPGEANAETHVELLERSGALARYRLSPRTGRRHQLRAHCAALGIPIVGDLIYPTLQPTNSDDHALPLQLLAKQLAFTDPVTGEERHFRSGLHLLPWSALP
jgi:tRNA pseudouridine32 synthase / 23S rRNA pseudouridine746 synthase